MTGHLFEINLVEDQDPFFQLGKCLFSRCKYPYSNTVEKSFDTGTSADLVETDQKTTQSNSL